jgi:hypothetical protein
MTHMQEPSIWERLDSLSDEELAYLTSAAMAVLAEHADPQLEDPTKLPHNLLIAETRAALAPEGIDVGESDAAEVVSDADLTRSMELSLLRNVERSPLKDEVGDVYERLHNMMVLDGGLLLGGAVLILVLKLKRIKIGDSEIEFYDVKADLLNAIRSFLGSH